MVVGKRCGTCIDRKIHCDRGVPACSNCTQTNRACQGYGLRLSWPRDHDGKRFVIGPVPPRGQYRGRAKHAHAVHVTSWDMVVYRYLTEARLAGKTSTPLPSYPAPFSVPSLMPANEIELLHFCVQVESSVSGSLTTFGEKPVGSLILRIALSGNSPSTIAVQRAVLALSYISRYGAGLKADQWKISALRALIASAGMGISSVNAVQHVAAGMILCLFEISHDSESSQQWMWYINGAKDVIANAPAGSFTEENGFFVLIDWAYYHEVMARFSMRHWRPRSTRGRVRNSPEQHFCLRSDEIDTNLAQSSMFKQRNRALGLLAEVCKAVLPPSDPRRKTEGYKETIKALARRVESCEIFHTIPPQQSSEPNAEKHSVVLAELHQIGMLIYLARAGSGAPKYSEESKTLVDRGIGLLASLSHCDRPFPVLMIGFEARDDDERQVVLELIVRTQRHPYPRHRLECVRNLLHGVWNQADLHAEDGVEFDYMETLTAVVSTSEIMPPFV